MWILFLVYPLIAFVIATLNFHVKKYRIFILAFLVLFGYSFLPIPESDGDKYKNEYINIEEYSFKDYVNDLKLFYDGESINPDIYIETITFLSHLVSSNYKFFFLVVALVYFYVALKLIGTVRDFIYERNLKYSIIFLIGIATIFNIGFGLNGIRFPLAFWVFCYGAIHLIFQNKLKFLLIALLASFIHFSLFYSCIFLAIFYFTRSTNPKPYVIYLLLIATFVFSELFPDFIANYLQLFGDSYSSKLNAYTNENFIETREEHVKKWNWYIQFNQFSTYYFCIASLILSKLRLFRLRFDTIANRLFTFSMIMLISSILSGTLVDSISNRYYSIFTFFTLAYLLYLSSLNYERTFTKFNSFIFTPILVLHILIILRIDLYTVNASLVFGNSISVFLVDSSTSIYQLFFG